MSFKYLLILFSVFTLISFETPEECLRKAIKESHTEFGMKLAAIECFEKHPELREK